MGHEVVGERLDPDTDPESRQSIASAIREAEETVVFTGSRAAAAVWLTVPGGVVDFSAVSSLGTNGKCDTAECRLRWPSG